MPLSGRLQLCVVSTGAWYQPLVRCINLCMVSTACALYQPVHGINRLCIVSTGAWYQPLVRCINQYMVSTACALYQPARLALPLHALIIADFACSCSASVNFHCSFHIHRSTHTKKYLCITDNSRCWLPQADKANLFTHR